MADPTGCEAVAARDEKYAVLARDLGEGGVISGGGPADPARDAGDVLWDPDQIDDDVLALTRITRAKKTFGAARVLFGVPPAQERAGWLGSVLSVVYLIFTEGSSASFGQGTRTAAVSPALIRRRLGLLGVVPVVRW